MRPIRRLGRTGVVLALLTALLSLPAPTSAAVAPVLPTTPAAAPALPETSTWPLAERGEVLKGFDPPLVPWGPGHRGVDLAAEVGASVRAAAAGRVTFAGLLAGRGVVVVDHGGVKTTYEPVTALVTVGSQVRSGQVIGVVAAGSHCGPSPCLHWGLRHGKTYLDPLRLAADPSTEQLGPVRLLPASAPRAARRRAAARAVLAAAARAATASGMSSRTSSAGGFALPVSGAITSAFGRRLHPVLKVWKLHDGTDFGVPCGSPIRAPYPGVVTRSYVNPAYGLRLFVDHGQVNGRHVVTSYNHASDYRVGVGAHVGRGEVLGSVGATGYATGCHLHLMVWLDGQLTDPMRWF